jgi:uncharacterized repeat protein (TIGR03803 family)
MDDTRSCNQFGSPLRRPTISNALRIGLPLLAITAGLATPLVAGAADFKVLHSFPTNANPASTLVEGPDGTLYGTNPSDGPQGYGTVFRVTPGGDFTNLFSFGYTNGARPSTRLIFGDDDALYGTASSGGPIGWYGTIFRLTTNGALTTLAFFTGSNGANPNSLTRGSDGNFYGTTAAGGAYTNSSVYGDGTVFRVTTNGLLTSLASFSRTNGCSPYAPLVQGPDGALYGTTPYGGPYTNPIPSLDSYGTVFKVTTNGLLTPLVFFASTNGAYPHAPLVEGRDGMLYGTTESGGTADWGTVYRVTPEGMLTTLVNFDLNTTGVYPSAGLVEGCDGAFYGTTTQGSFTPDRYSGTIFRVTTNGLFSPVYSFAELEGRWSQAALIQHSDGAFYGTCTYGGGTENAGTVFRVDLTTHVLPPKGLSTNATQVTVACLPASSHWVLRATNPSGPWSIMATVTADTNGIASWLDSSPPPGQGFYRAALPQALMQ